MALESQANLEIKHDLYRTIFNTLSIGDIVIDPSNEVSLLIKKNESQNGYWVTLLQLAGSSYHFLETGDLFSIKQMMPWHHIENDKFEALKLRLEWANQFHPKIVDNLTYIEILDRLKQYELNA